MNSKKPKLVVVWASEILDALINPVSVVGLAFNLKP
jgi:hypothetical protein